MVIVNGQKERHPEGAYYLDWYEGSKRKRLSVGNDAANAYARKLRKQAELNAIAQGIPIAQEPEEEAGRSLQAAIAQYLEETRLTKKKRHWQLIQRRSGTSGNHAQSSTSKR
jgi:hypothetical protein